MGYGSSRKLLSLKYYWFSQERFSIYSNEALVVVAKHSIPTFTDYLSLANRELKVYKRQLPMELYYQINAYLLDLEEEITCKKVKLCQAMLVRLQVASSTKNIHFDDVTLHIARQLKELNLIKTNTRLPLHPSNELSRYRQFFQEFIMQQGAEEQKNDLRKLIW